MKRMSFGLTLEPFLLGLKTVTRRKGWRGLQPGERVRAVDRVMGLKRGEKSESLGIIEILSVRQERLGDITDAEVTREGFPGKDAAWFCGRFAHAMGGSVDRTITRIEFRVLEYHQPGPGVPTSTEEWEALRSLSGDQLKERGLGNWDGRLFLFPGGWYSCIPKGMQLETINGKEISFQPGESPAGVLFGCLAYGLVAVDGEVVVPDVPEPDSLHFKRVDD